MKYRKKPVVVEAFQYDGDFKGADGNYYVPGWAIDALFNGTMYYSSLSGAEPPCELYIATLEGNHHVSVGDYIIRGVAGELYPCKPDIFSRTYEAVCDERSVDEKVECKWIPCTERLPEERGPYLVSYGKNTFVFTEEWNGCCFSERHYIGQPKAWTPMPEPYEGE